MAQYKNFVNGGSLLPGDLNAIEADYEYAFSTYKVVATESGRLDAPTTGTYLLGTGSPATAASGALAGNTVRYLDPSRFSVGSPNARTVYYNLVASVVTNATAVGTVTLTVGLYPVTASAGAAATVSVTLGTVQSGSTAAFTNPGSGATAEVASGNFTAPSAGYFTLGVVVSANAAANSSVAVRATLLMQQQ